MSPPRPVVSPPLDTAALPWIPLGPGLSFKPLRFLRQLRGRILLLRLEPGTLIPRHRHGGEVHAFNLRGHRKLLETQEMVGPGGYVYEPPGNVDSWMAVGDEEVVVHITAYGAMESLDAQDAVLRRDTAATLLDCYRRFCAERGIVPLDLLEPDDVTGVVSPQAVG